MKLSDRIKQGRFANSSQEAIFGVIVTSNWIISRLADRMAPYGVTQPQYNVLRILRGSHPRSLTCSEIGQRLLDRTPDVTRMLNRLERNGLIIRERSGSDRRVVEVNISEKGLHLLSEMQDDVEGEVVKLTSYLSEEERHQLSELLDRMRTEEQE